MRTYFIVEYIKFCSKHRNIGFISVNFSPNWFTEPLCKQLCLINVLLLLLCKTRITHILFYITPHIDSRLQYQPEGGRPEGWYLSSADRGCDVEKRMNNCIYYMLSNNILITSYRKKLLLRLLFWQTTDNWNQIIFINYGDQLFNLH